ncbi:hypothetical protein JCM33374_g1364 [Metschnikowia sp. JCM 33374]|nr:hypothetical protein JCM33374_g1364 [Metschnikowia sp. JCM 33374]
MHAVTAPIPSTNTKPLTGRWFWIRPGRENVSMQNGWNSSTRWKPKTKQPRVSEGTGETFFSCPDRQNVMGLAAGTIVGLEKGRFGLGSWLRLGRHRLGLWLWHRQVRGRGQINLFCPNNNFDDGVLEPSPTQNTLLNIDSRRADFGAQAPQVGVRAGSHGSPT